MTTGFLGNFWTYDVEITGEKHTQTEAAACFACSQKEAEAGIAIVAAEEEKRCNEQLRSENDRLNATIRQLATMNVGLREGNIRLKNQLLHLHSKFRSLEHGGGIPQPAPPDAGRQGSGGGVAASPGPSARAMPALSSGLQGPLSQVEDREKSGGIGGGGGVGRSSQYRRLNPTDVSSASSGGGSGIGGCSIAEMRVVCPPAGIQEGEGGFLAASRGAGGVEDVARVASSSVIAELLASAARSAADVSPFPAPGVGQFYRQQQHQLIASPGEGKGPSQQQQPPQQPGHPKRDRDSSGCSSPEVRRKPPPLRMIAALLPPTPALAPAAPTVSVSGTTILSDLPPSTGTYASGGRAAAAAMATARMEARRPRTSTIPMRLSIAIDDSTFSSESGDMLLLPEAEQDVAEAPDGSYAVQLPSDLSDVGERVGGSITRPDSLSTSCFSSSLMSPSALNSEEVALAAAAAAAAAPSTKSAHSAKSSAYRGCTEEPACTGTENSTAFGSSSGGDSVPASAPRYLTHSSVPLEIMVPSIDDDENARQRSVGEASTASPIAHDDSRNAALSGLSRSSDSRDTAVRAREEEQQQEEEGVASPPMSSSSSSSSSCPPWSPRNQQQQQQQQQQQMATSPRHHDNITEEEQQRRGEEIKRRSKQQQERKKLSKKSMIDEERRILNESKMSKEARTKKKKRVERLTRGEGEGEGGGGGGGGSSGTEGMGGSGRDAGGRDAGNRRDREAFGGKKAKERAAPSSERRVEEGVITVRHKHVLQCYQCGKLPEADERRDVFFCAKCPRKTCLSCQENGGSSTSEDRAIWEKGCDEYGSYYIDPLCGKCKKGSDNEIPTRDAAWGLRDDDSRDAITDRRVRLVLKRCLAWLELHDMSHFFLRDVDDVEYPEYRKMVKHPMNFERMRARLNAGEYDDRRRGLNEFKEDLAWIVYNCKLFNGPEPAISRCADILEKRFKGYWTAHIDPLQSMKRSEEKPGWKHEPRKKSIKETTRSPSNVRAWGPLKGDASNLLSEVVDSGRVRDRDRQNSGKKPKRGAKPRLIRGASSCSDSTDEGDSGGRGSPGGLGVGSLGLTWVMPRQSPSHPSNDENNSSGSNSSNNNDMNGGGEKISKVRTRFAFEGEPSDGVLRPANAADRSTVRAVPAGERPQGRSFSLWSSDKSAEQGADEGRSDDVADVTASASASATTCSKNHRVITSAEAAAIATATAGIASSRDSAEEGEVVYGETEEQCGGGIVSVSVLRGNEQVGVELAEEEYEEHDGRENDDNRIPAVGSLPGCFGDGLDLIGVDIPWSQGIDRNSSML